MRTTLRAAIAVFALLLAAAALAACGSSSKDAGSSTRPLVVKIDIKGRTVSPNGARLDAKVGQKVTLEITSDQKREVHVHSGGEGHELEVPPGHKTFSFTTERPGLIPIEAHDPDVTIAQLEVK